MRIFIVLTGVFLLVGLVCPASAQSWDEWQRLYYEDRPDDYVPPSDERLARERYINAIQRQVDPMIRTYANSLSPEERRLFLSGKVMLQVNQFGRPRRVELQGNYQGEKREFRRFIRMLERSRFPKFPEELGEDSRIEFQYTLNPVERRYRTNYRYMQRNRPRPSY